MSSKKWDRHTCSCGCWTSRAESDWMLFELQTAVCAKKKKRNEWCRNNCETEVAEIRWTGYSLVSSFSHFCDEGYLTKRFKGRVSLDPQFEGRVGLGEDGRVMGFEAAGHIASAGSDRKRWILTPSSLCSVQDTRPCMVSPSFKVGLPISVYLIFIFPRCVQRLILSWFHILSTSSTSYRDLQPTNIYILSRSTSCQHLHPIKIYILSTSASYQHHLQLIKIYSLSISASYQDLHSINITYILSRSTTCQHLRPIKIYIL